MSRGDEHRQARQNVRWDQSRTPKMTPHVLPDCWLSIFLALTYVPKLLWIDGHSVVDAKKGVPSLSASFLAVILVEYAITPHQLKEGSQCNMVI